MTHRSIRTDLAAMPDTNRWGGNDEQGILRSSASSDRCSCGWSSRSTLSQEDISRCRGGEEGCDIHGVASGRRDRDGQNGSLPDRAGNGRRGSMTHNVGRESCIPLFPAQMVERILVASPGERTAMSHHSVEMSASEFHDRMTGFGQPGFTEYEVKSLTSQERRHLPSRACPDLERPSRCQGLD